MSIRRRRHGHVEVLTLDRAHRRNALDRAMVEGIGRTVREVEADPEVRALVVTGAGTAFCAGMDLTQVGSAPLARSADAQSFMTFLETGCRKPVVAAVNGAAVAGGFEVVLACDLVVAAEDARLGLPEVRRGLVAGGGGTLLPLRLPRAVALEVGLTGVPLTAQRAFEVGLVNRVVVARDVLSTALALAEEIAGNSPAAVRATKELMWQAGEQSRARTWERIHEATAQLLSSPDAVEGAAAFLEKREPVWPLIAD